MNGHLVAVKVGVKGMTDQRMNLDGRALDQHSFEGLNAETVKRGSTVQEDRMVFDDLFQARPKPRDVLAPRFAWRS